MRAALCEPVRGRADWLALAKRPPAACPPSCHVLARHPHTGVQVRSLIAQQENKWTTSAMRLLSVAPTDLGKHSRAAAAALHAVYSMHGCSCVRSVWLPLSWHVITASTCFPCAAAAQVADLAGDVVHDLSALSHTRAELSTCAAAQLP